MGKVVRIPLGSCCKYWPRGGRKSVGRANPVRIANNKLFLLFDLAVESYKNNKKTPIKRKSSRYVLLVSSIKNRKTEVLSIIW